MSLEGYSPWGCKELDTTEPLGKPKLQVIVGIHNGLPQGGNLSPPPVKDCKQGKLTQPPCLALAILGGSWKD